MLPFGITRGQLPIALPDGKLTWDPFLLTVQARGPYLVTTTCRVIDRASKETREVHVNHHLPGASLDFSLTTQIVP